MARVNIGKRSRHDDETAQVTFTNIDTGETVTHTLTEAQANRLVGVFSDLRQPGQRFIVEVHNVE